MLLRNVLLAIGIFVLLVGAALGVTWMLRSPKSGISPVEASQQVAVLTATHAIASGALLGESDMAWRNVPRSTASPGNLMKGQATPAQFSGAVTRRSFANGEALVRSGLLLPNERGFLAAVLAPGHRAVTIPVNESQSASGLLLPGDHVDVVLLQDLKDSGIAGLDYAHKDVGETVLSNARVVAVDRRLSGAEVTPASTSDATPTPAAQAAAKEGPKTITLEVTPQDAQRLFVAAQLGKLQVSLRAFAQPEGPTPVAAEATWAADVSPALQSISHASQSRERVQATPEGAAPVVRAAPTARRVRQAPPPVTVMRGAKIETQ